MKNILYSITQFSGIECWILGLNLCYYMIDHRLSTIVWKNIGRKGCFWCKQLTSHAYYCHEVYGRSKN